MFELANIGFIFINNIIKLRVEFLLLLNKWTNLPILGMMAPVQVLSRTVYKQSYFLRHVFLASLSVRVRAGLENIGVQNLRFLHVGNISLYRKSLTHNYSLDWNFCHKAIQSLSELLQPVVKRLVIM